MRSRELLLQDDWEEFELTSSHVLHTASRFLPAVVAAMAIAFLFGLVISPAFRAQVGAFRLGGGVSIRIPPMPVAEPLTLKNVSMTTAREINAKTPMTTKPVEAAAPFLFFGKPQDMSRAIDCIAATIYYEAGNEAIEGQLAVVQVVLNRVRHPAYPKTICGVVFQGHERRTGCQFSYTCDGSMVRRRPPAEAWARFRGIGRAMLNGLVYQPVGLATHYHTDWVLPAWSSRLDKVRVERTHLFFRFTGYWGTPTAFRGRYLGIEPQLVKLGALSPEHLGGEGVAADAPPLTPEQAIPLHVTEADKVGFELPEYAAASADGEGAASKSADAPKKEGVNTFMIYVDPLLESDALTRLAERACSGQTPCKVYAWADQDLMPKGLAVDPSARAAMAFSYVRVSAKAGRSSWNCDLFPREKATECMKRKT